MLVWLGIAVLIGLGGVVLGRVWLMIFSVSAPVEPVQPADSRDGSAVIISLVEIEKAREEEEARVLAQCTVQLASGIEKFGGTVEAPGGLALQKAMQGAVDGTKDRPCVLTVQCDGQAVAIEPPVAVGVTADVVVIDGRPVPASGIGRKVQPYQEVVRRTPMSADEVLRRASAFSDYRVALNRRAAAALEEVVVEVRQDAERMARGVLVGDRLVKVIADGAARGLAGEAAQEKFIHAVADEMEAEARRLYRCHGEFLDRAINAYNGPVAHRRPVL